MFKACLCSGRLFSILAWGICTDHGACGTLARAKTAFGRSAVANPGSDKSRENEGNWHTKTIQHCFLLVQLLTPTCGTWLCTAIPASLVHYIYLFSALRAVVTIGYPTFDLRMQETCPNASVLNFRSCVYKKLVRKKLGAQLTNSSSERDWQCHSQAAERFFWSVNDMCLSKSSRCSQQHSGTCPPSLPSLCSPELFEERAKTKA